MMVIIVIVGDSPTQHGIHIEVLPVIYNRASNGCFTYNINTICLNVVTCEYNRIFQCLTTIVVVVCVFIQCA
jgi:hypothetical protein